MSSGFVPATNALSGINVAYDPTATCPTFDRLIRDAFPSADSRKLAQQVVGASILGYRPDGLRGMLFVIGSPYGRDGKTSLFEKTVRRLLGADSFHSVRSLEEVTGREEGRFHLVGKQYLLLDDCDRTRPIKANDLKAIAEARHVSTRELFRGGLARRISVMAVSLSNGWPVVEAFDPATMSRVLILKMDKSHRREEEAGEPNPWEEVWGNEMSGVLNWGLEGLRTLIEDRRFHTENPEHQQLKREFMMRCSYPYRFLARRYEVDSASTVEWTALVSGYRAWMEAEQPGLRRMSSTELVAALEMFGDCDVSYDIDGWKVRGLREIGGPVTRA